MVFVICLIIIYVTGTYGLDGIFYDWYDELLGRFNDRRFQTESGINTTMQIIQAGNEKQYIIFGGK